MNPDAYRNAVIPKIKEMLMGNCVCKNGKLRKIMSFDFNDYGISPVGCGDTEVLIQDLIRSNKNMHTKEMATEGKWKFKCIVCGEGLFASYEEYSISMQCSSIHYERKSNIRGLIMTGYFGFDSKSFDKITDFDRTESISEYLKYLEVV